MSMKLLLVDDDVSLLSGLSRRLKLSFDLCTASSGAEGLKYIQSQGPFAVVVTDMRMPNMDGLGFIAAARKTAKDTIFIMLTGNQDLETASRAVNEGEVFRFLTKPCQSDQLKTAIEAGIRQYQLVTAEHELLHKTFAGSVKLLNEVIELSHPEIADRACRIRTLTERLIPSLGIENRWEYRLAAQMSQIGLLTVPEEVAQKALLGAELDDNERQIAESYAAVGERLMKHIPRLENVAAIVGGHVRSNGEICNGNSQEDIIRNGAALLRIATEIATLQNSNLSDAEIDTRLREVFPDAPEGLRDAVTETTNNGDAGATLTVETLSIADLREGMILHRNIVTNSGRVLLASGKTITGPLIEKLRNYSHFPGLKPIEVIRAAENGDQKTPAGKLEFATASR